MPRCKLVLLFCFFSVLVCHSVGAQNVSANEVRFPKSLANGRAPNQLKKNETLSLAADGGMLSLSDVPTNDVFAAVGHGYDPITGEIGRIDCVVGKDQEVLPPYGYTFADQVSDEKSMAKASGSSIGASGMINVVSLGVGTSSTNSSMFNSVERYGRIVSRLVTVSRKRAPVQWSTDAKGWLESGDFPKFFANCGTRYVQAVYAGFALDSTVYFQLNETTRSASNATSLSVGVGKIFGASGSFCNAQSDVSAVATAKLQSYSKGVALLPTVPAAASGAGAPAPAPANPPQPVPGSSTGCAASTTAGAPILPPSPLQTAIDYYNNDFRKAVIAADKSKAVPLYIATVRYYDDRLRGLDGAEKIPTWSDNLIEAVLSKQDTYDDLLGVLSDMEFATKRYGDGTTNLPILYTDTDVAAKKETGAKMLGAFQQAVVYCQKLVVQAKSDVPDPDNPGSTISAVTLCQKKLDDGISDAKVGAIKLTRKYAP